MAKLHTLFTFFWAELDSYSARELNNADSVSGLSCDNAKIRKC